MAPEKTSHFADLLRRARLAAGLTPEELAEAAGISVRAVSNLERGINRAPHRYTLELLADALHLSDEARAEWAAVSRRVGRQSSGMSHKVRGPLEREHPYDLPAPVTPLLGREVDIASVVERLCTPSVRLVTLTGPGGVGKTRLALAVADELAGADSEFAYVVGLAALRDPELVMSAIATVLGVQETGSQPLLETLTSYLRSKRLLLVLDNFEHVLSAATDVSNLLAACPMLSVFVTSRAALRLQMEHEIEVPPLALPNTPDLPIGELTKSPAVALFVERARMIKADFALSKTNADTVAAICTRMEGLPLAIELAAARIKLLTPQALLGRLERPLALLTDGARDAPARQQTIRRTISWSYELLTPDEQRLLRQLSVFVGGWTLEAAEAVCDVDSEVLSGLHALLDHSLVKAWEQPDGSSRFRMLETIREFAAEQLLELDELPRLKERHAAFFVQFAEEARPALMRGSEQGQWLDQLESELENLRVALTWLVRENDTERAHRFVVALDDFWWARGRYQEACEWLKKVISLPGEVSSNTKADALSSLGFLLKELGAYDESFEAYERAIVLYQGTNDLTGLAQAYCDSGALALYRGQYSRAAELHERSLEIARTNDDLYGLSRSLAGLSVVTAVNGDFQRATALAGEFLAASCEIGDEIGRAGALGYLGYIALWQNDLETSYQRAYDCIAVTRDLGEIGWLSFGLMLLAHIELERGEYQTAEDHFCESLRGVWGRREVMPIAECLEGLAGTAAGLGDSKRAARLLGAAASLRERVGTPLPPPRVDRYERTVDATRKELSDAAFEAMKSEGYSWPLEQAIDCALEETPAVPQSVERSSAPVAGLSKREVEVLQLLAGGLSDREIAETLFISRHTVMRHVSNILRKLDVNSRTAAAAWAVRNGLA
jgi:predicted ATPase/DNA-binding CsgD family transcriptional regulator